MCGGVIFPFKEVYREALAEYYSPEQIEEFEQTGQVKSVYWQKTEPVLPVVSQEDEDDEPKEEVLLWGNRDKEAPFPQTGWAREDSIESGKWAYMKPKPALIPVTHGVEKGRWFDIDEGIHGVIVQKGGERRVYMLTQDATSDFLAATKHDRMPVLEGQNSFNWLPGEPGRGTNYAQESLPLE